ncbi:MAG: DUF4349 domain-containing protein [Candidatus Dormibacteria bacterium]
MTPTPTAPSDDELIGELRRYFAATEVAEPPFRTRVADSVSVARRAVWRRSLTVVAATLSVVALLAAGLLSLRPSFPGGGAATSSLPAFGGGSQTVNPQRNGLVAPAEGFATASGAAAASGTTDHGPGPSFAAAPGTTGSGAAIVVGTPQGKVERSVTASYTVPGGSFLPSFDSLISRAVGMGGFVVSSSTAPDGSGRIVAGSVTVRVPSDRLSDFINGMPASFATSSINFSSVDHTADYTDLSARLASAQAELAALNGLLTKATALGDVISLEQQVATVQSQIDSYQGQLNVIQNQVSMSTATIQLSERGSAPAPAPAPNPVTGGLATGWSNAVAFTGALLSGLVTLVPVFVIALVIAAAWVVVRRRRSRP